MRPAPAALPRLPRLLFSGIAVWKLCSRYRPMYIDDRRIETIANGLSLQGGAQLAVGTLMSAFNVSRARRDRAAAQSFASRAKECLYPALLRCELCCAGRRMVAECRSREVRACAGESSSLLLLLKAAATAIALASSTDSTQHRHRDRRIVRMSMPRKIRCSSVCGKFKLSARASRLSSYSISPSRLA